MDNVLVSDATKEQHDKRPHLTLTTASKAGLSFNVTKCKLGTSKLMHLRNVTSQYQSRQD